MRYEEIIQPLYEVLSDAEEKRLILDMCAQGYTPLSAVLNHWKDNHVDGDVRTKAGEAVDVLTAGG